MKNVCRKALILIFNLSLVGCFSAPQSAQNKINKIYSYEIQLATGQKNVTTSLPVYLNLSFNEKINSKYMKSTYFNNLGTSTGLKIAMEDKGDQKNFLLVISEASPGTIELSLTQDKLENLGLKLEAPGSQISVLYEPVVSSFKALDKLSPLDAKGDLKNIGILNDRFFYISGGELYSTYKNYGTTIKHSNGNNTVSNIFPSILGSKIFVMRSEGASKHFPAVYDSATSSFFDLGVKNPSGRTMYQINTSQILVDVEKGLRDDFRSPFMMLANGEVLFGADDGTESSLYITDGSVLGTQKIYRLEDSGKLNLRFMERVGDYAYFTHSDPGLSSSRRAIYVYNSVTKAIKKFDITAYNISLNKDKRQYFPTANRLYYRNSSPWASYYIEGENNPVLMATADIVEHIDTVDGKIYYQAANEELWEMDFATNANSKVLDGIRNFHPPLHKVGNYLVGRASTTDSGTARYLWSLNLGTSTLTNITGSQTTYYLGRLGDRLFFSYKAASDSAQSLYSYEAGVGLVKLLDFPSGELSRENEEFYSGVVGAKLYVISSMRYIRTDGTVLGTEVVADYPAWAKNNVVNYIYPFETGFFVGHWDVDHNLDLFYQDSLSLDKVADLKLGFEKLSVSIAGSVGDKILFSVGQERNAVSDQIWISDSSSEGTLATSAQGAATGFTDWTAQFGSMLYIIGYNATGRMRIYESDLTVAGTRDVTPASIGDQSYTYSATMVSTPTHMYFNAYDATNSSLGFYAFTPGANTAEQVSTSKTIDSMAVQNYQVLDDNRLFLDAYYGNVSIVSDGTAAGTFEVTSSAESTKSYYLDGTTLYYNVGTSLYKSDLNIPGNRSLIIGDAGSSLIGAASTMNGFYYVINNKLVFAADSQLGTVDLSTNTGGDKLYDFNAASSSDLHSGQYSYRNTKNAKLKQEVGGKMLVFSSDSKLFLTDGISDTFEVGAASPFDPYLIHNSKLYLFTSSGYYVSDGTALGTSFDTALGGTVSNSSVRKGTSYKVISDNLAFIFLDNGNGNYQLYQLKDSAFTLVSEFSKTDSSGTATKIGCLEYKDSRLLFTAYSSEYGEELMITDGISGHVKVIADVVPGIGSGYPNSVTFTDTKIYFLSDGTYKTGMLWVSNWADILASGF